MLSINTNISNLIAQRALFSSGKKLNQSLQRLSSGMRINNAGDDAAGLALSSKLNFEIKGLSQAKINTQTGMNYLQTADGAISTMLISAQRIRDLAVQSANGVLSGSERKSMQQEVNELQKELSQTQESTKFSDKNIFGETSKFIKNVNPLSKEEAQALGFVTISSAEEFVNAIAQDGSNTAGKTFILTNDIDMSAISDYEGRKNFEGTFDGNGYKIKNLSISRTLADNTNAALFASSNNATFQNVSIENANINVSTRQSYSGILVGNATSTNVENCYSSGTISNNTDPGYVGGLVGYSSGGRIVDSFSTANVNYGIGVAGGLIGGVSGSATIINCYASGNINGASAGGLVGTMQNSSSIKNSYATGNVNGSIAGGLVGTTDGGSIEGSYATGNVTGFDTAGGLIGMSQASIKNCYTTGNVTSQTGGAGGITGYNNGSISNCYATGKIKGLNAYSTGGITGYSGSGASISNCNFNKDTTGQTVANGEGRGTSTNTKALSSAEMGRPTNFATWDNSVWDFAQMPPTLKTFTKDIPKTSKNILSLQIGTKNNESSKIEMDTSFDIGTLNFDISTENSARQTIKNVDKFIEELTSKQSEFGASINILESILSSQDLKKENLSSSYSTILDTDIAKESALLTKNQILQNISSSLVFQSSKDYASLLLALLTPK